MATRMKEKTERVNAMRDRRPMAIARYIRIPSSKVEIVLDLIRGKSYDESVAILKNTVKSASPVVLKVLNSAAANAENNQNIMKDNLYVAECYATAGPTLKRMMPRARGRADRILKRTSHIKVILAERENASRGTRAKVKGTKAVDSKKEVVTVKTPKTVNQANAKSTGTKANTNAKPVPNTQSERPLTTQPNTKKPLGAKKEEKAPVTDAKTTKVESKPAAKTTAKKS